MVCASCSVGRKNRITSSAYTEILGRFLLAFSSDNKPTDLAFNIITCIVSITRTNSNGDSGSPCLNPLAGLIGADSIPLISILVSAVKKSAASQDLHRGPKPLYFNMSRRKHHDTVSNAFEMSSLRKIISLRWRWNCCDKPLTKIKFSWMHLPLINAVWVYGTSSSILGTILCAIILEASLEKLCIRLIGLPSSSWGASVLGISVMTAELSISRFWELPSVNFLKAFSRSSLITPQHCW